MDFYEIRVRKRKDGHFEIYPEFLIGDSNDLMIRGKDFYAVFDEKVGMWNRNPKALQRIIDSDIYKKMEELRSKYQYEDVPIELKLMKEDSSGSWLRFIKYAKNLPDDYHQLDEKIAFQDTVIKREDYISKRLPYSLKEGDISAYDELMSTLYSPEERAKFEWAIGSIIAGDSRKIQKFIVFSGPMGSGKSTVMNLIEKLFGGYNRYKGYCTKINAKALTGSNVGFALEPFACSPLVGIDQDSKLSRIEDNTILNQIVSHDTLQINEKFKNLYDTNPHCFLFMGTNEPVKITDSKSGVIRRLIDVEPTGNIIQPESKYEELVEKMNYELGAIAKHCLNVYRKMGKSYYSNYRPTRMMVRTDHFFNFMKDNIEVFIQQGGVTANELWNMYKTWCNDSGMDFTLKKYQALDEAKNYFEAFSERPYINGKQLRNWYSGLKMDKFISEDHKERKEEVNQWAIPKWLNLQEGIESILDKELADFPAQYGDEKPAITWKNCRTKLKDLDTRQTHYVQCPSLMIHMDFDKKNEKGEKDFLLNAKAASAYPETYAELSKGGKGIHLTYYYDGNPDDLSRVVEEGVEIKVQIGNAALRRKLFKCNKSPIAHISSGLPLRNKKVINDNALKDAKHLRTRILKALRKEIEPGFTTTCINYIEAQLMEAQEKNIPYDISDLDNAIYSFAASSTHNSESCIKKYFNMKLIWPEPPKQAVYEEDIPENKRVFIPNTNQNAPIVFCDIEVGKNLLLVCYKEQGPGKKVVKIFNPNPVDLEALFKMRLFGFNCRTYDGVILYARYIGYSLRDCWQLSQDIIVNDKRNNFTRDAEYVFEGDIYDYSTDKKSLKKWEIQLAQEGKLSLDAHMEMNVDWSEDIPEELWPTLAEYCEHDVIATEAVFEATAGDYKAHEILAELSDLPFISTTNQMTTKIIFGDVKEPWHDFNYPNLAEMFPGYRFEGGKSYFNDVLIGEGGRVYAEPGMYYNVKTFDVASMHPSSIIAENGFGPYTAKFKNLMDIRIAIKHKDFDKVRELDSRLDKYMDDPAQAKALSFALKIAINSVYGLTAARFQNKFKDPRNVDNWVAKRGALFMETLRLKVQSMGAKVVHIKTDSIKIEKPTPEIETFILDYGKKWGYNFEVESIYDRICLVNDAVYIARCSNDEANGDEAGHWTATGAQFQHPYIFKTLFSKEKVTFDDLCEQRAVKTDIWLDMNEGLEDVTAYEKELTKVDKKLKDLWGLNWDKMLRILCEQEVPIGTDDLPMEKVLESNKLIAQRGSLLNSISKGHDYQFVGRVGLFCPIISGKGGGLLMRKGTNGSYSSVAGSKGYRWLEASRVKELKYDKYIDMSYFHDLASVAVETIEKFGPFDGFVDSIPFDGPYITKSN